MLNSETVADKRSRKLLAGTIVQSYLEKLSLSHGLSSGSLVADKDFLYQTRISGGRQGSLVADTETAAELHAQHSPELLQHGHFGFHDPWAPSSSGFLFCVQFEGRSIKTRLNWRWNDHRGTSTVCRSRILNCSFKSQSLSPCHGPAPVACVAPGGQVKSPSASDTNQVTFPAGWPQLSMACMD